MIGLDAADPSLVERWSDEGHLPNLASLRARGAWGRLDPVDGVGVGPPWPSFYTGSPVSAHGLYSYLIWSGERMTEVRPDPRTLPLEPFWRHLGPDGPRVVAFDVPLVYAPGPFNGVELSGWATHEHFGPAASYPPDLLGSVEARFGKAPLLDEVHARVEVRRLLEERDSLVATSGRVAAVGTHLLEDEPWDLGIVCLSTAHRAGHKLWSAAGSTGRGGAHEHAELKTALGAVYEAVDRAVGTLVASAGPETTVVVFALHGMGPNTSLVDALPTMVARILGADTDHVVADPLLRRIRRSVPRRWRDAVKRSLPLPVQDRLSAFWRTSRLDWTRTPAFCLTGDLHGFVRINLRGREAEGIVEPGAEYDALVRRLTEGLLTFVDVETGTPVVRRVVRPEELPVPEGRRADLPDLTVVWDDRPASARREIRSDCFGSIFRDLPGGYPDGRSGNHCAQGFAIVVGPTVEGGTLRSGATILDLAPTALAALGVAQPRAMSGRPLTGAPRRFR